MTSGPSRAEALDAVLAALRETLATLEAAANLARDEATHEDTKQEGKYDTRAIEAGYLAGAQARRAVEAADALRRIAALPRAERDDDVVAGPCLVTLRSDAGVERCYLLAPCAGGLVARVGETDVRVVTPSSPLGAALLGAEVDDEVRADGSETRWTIVAVR